MNLQGSGLYSVNMPEFPLLWYQLQWRKLSQKVIFKVQSKVKNSKAIPVIGRGGLKGCEMLSIAHVYTVSSQQ
jgi:hypothetical protein